MDRAGRRVAFQAPLVGRGPPYGFLLYDEDSGKTFQLTDDPEAIPVGSRPPEACPRTLGSTPLVSADGRRVVFITPATLGIEVPDPTIGCYVFAYDRPQGTITRLASLPKGMGLDLATLSDDGRWLSFTNVSTVPPNPRQGFPALLDLETGELNESLIGITGFTTFDSVITGDGTKVVISTQADLDLSVGNADHNMEIFVYDRASGAFTQVTETIGGIGRTPGGCESYMPQTSGDARVLGFSFPLFSVESCSLDGPQRSETSGFYLGRVRAVQKRPGNQGPVFDPPSVVIVRAGELLILDLSATDPDGDPITFFAQEVDGIDVPRGSEIEDHHDGTATFTWPTTPENVGTYALRVAAFDEGGGEVLHDVEIAIVAGDCTGDCDGDRKVIVGELVTGVEIALGKDRIEDCPSLDADRSAGVSVDELVSATSNAMRGCR